jgi:phosphoserine phosphatase RsbU/P
MEGVQPTVLVDVLDTRRQELLVAWRAHAHAEDMAGWNTKLRAAFLSALTSALRERPAQDPFLLQALAHTVAEYARTRLRERVLLDAVIQDLGLFREILLEVMDSEGISLRDPAICALRRALDVGLAESLSGFTDAKRLEAAHARALDALEHGEAFVILDSDWRVAMANRNAELLTRISREATIGQILWEVLPDLTPPSPVWREYHRVMEERIPRTFEAYYAPTDLWVLVSVYPLRDGGIAIFCRDISAQKCVEIEARRWAAFEQELVGIVSHDLRNPLNAILLSSAPLLQREELDDRTLRSVARIHTSAKRALGLIRDLLDFTQARLGRDIPVRRLPCDLYEMVRRVVEEVQMAHPERRVLFTSTGNGWGEWDEGRMSQVVTNLVGNALQHSAPDTEVQVTGQGDRRETVFLSVHNVGLPIPSEMLAKIFEPFQRGANANGDAGRSLGLGLYITQAIVKAHGGSIKVTSAEHVGTIFTVVLPRQPPRS